MTKKKSILDFVLAICLIVPAMFMFSACGKSEPFASATTLTFIDDGEGYYSTRDQTMKMEVGKTYEYKFIVNNFENGYYISFSNIAGEHLGADSTERNNAITVKIYNSTSDKGTILETTDDLNINKNITANGTYYLTFTSTMAGTQVFYISY